MISLLSENAPYGGHLDGNTITNIPFGPYIVNIVPLSLILIVSGVNIGG